MLESFCGGGGIRTPGRFSPTPVFKTGAINQLCHSSELVSKEDSKSTSNISAIQYFCPYVKQGNKAPVTLVNWLSFGALRHTCAADRLFVDNQAVVRAEMPNGS